MRARKRILVVDDEEMVRSIYRRVLEANGYEVEMFDNGVDALNNLQMSYFDLVITDFDMPLMKGDELSRKIENYRPDLPILMITGSDVSFTEHRASKVLKKPVLPHELIKAVDWLLP